MILHKRYKWHVVWMLWTISLFNYADRQAIFSVFPLLETELHLNLVQLGLLASAFAWVYGIGAQFAGMIVDRVSRKTAILGGLYAWSTICMATSLVHRFRFFLILRGAEGLGETFYYPASMSMLGDYHGPSTRSKAIGLHQTSVYAGTIVGGFFAGLISEYYGWRWSFVTFGGLGCVLGLVLNSHLKEPTRGAAEFAHYHTVDQPKNLLSTAQSVKLVWSTPTALLLMGAFVCANFVAVVLLSWMPKFVYDEFHMGLAMAGLTATAFVQLASIAGAVFGGWSADRLYAKTPRGRILVQMIGVLGGAPFVLLCGFTRSIAWLICGLTAWGFFKGSYDANIFASVFDVVRPGARGTAAGFMNTVGWLGGGAAPVIVGLLARRYGLGVGISLTSLIYLLAAALLFAAAFGFVREDAARMLRLDSRYAP